MNMDREELDEITKLLINLYSPQEIFLYGSYAWGTPSSDSDVDLCIILKESAKTQAERIRDGLRTLKDIRIPVDLLVLTENEIEERKDHPSTLIFKILHDGRKLYEAA